MTDFLKEYRENEIDQNNPEQVVDIQMVDFKEQMENITKDRK